MNIFFESEGFQAQVDQGFAECDSDDSGSIDKSELVKAMVEIKTAVAADGVELPEVDDAAVESCMSEFDKSGDGKLSKEEFYAFTRAVMEYALKQMME